tara:strand:+ start:272564 stop:276310 length:3747 start_codon:yes stop_codon:yes gene_type:complete
MIRKVISLLSCYSLLAFPLYAETPPGSGVLLGPVSDTAHSTESNSLEWFTLQDPLFFKPRVNYPMMPLSYSPELTFSGDKAEEPTSIFGNYSLSRGWDYISGSLSFPLLSTSKYVPAQLNMGNVVQDSRLRNNVESFEYGDFARPECNAYAVAPSVSLSINKLASHFDDNLCGSGGMGIQHAFADVLGNGSSTNLVDRTNFCDVTMNKASEGVCQGSKAGTQEVRNYIETLRSKERQKNLSKMRKESIMRNLMKRYSTISNTQNRLSSNLTFQTWKQLDNKLDNRLRCTPGKIQKVIMDSADCSDSDGKNLLAPLFTSQLKACEENPELCGFDKDDLNLKPSDIDTMTFVQLKNMSDTYKVPLTNIINELRSSQANSSMGIDDFLKKKNEDLHRRTVMGLGIVEVAMHGEDHQQISFTPKEAQAIQQARRDGNIEAIEEVLQNKAFYSLSHQFMGDRAPSSAAQTMHSTLQGAASSMQTAVSPELQAQEEFGRLMYDAINPETEDQIPLRHISVSSLANPAIAEISENLLSNGTLIDPNEVSEIVNNGIVIFDVSRNWVSNYANREVQKESISGYLQDSNKTENLSKLSKTLEDSGFFDTYGDFSKFTGTSAQLQEFKNDIAKDYIDKILNNEKYKSSLNSSIAAASASGGEVNQNDIAARLIELQLMATMYENSIDQCDNIEKEAKLLCRQSKEGDHFNGILALDEINDLGNPIDSNEYFGGDMDPNDATFKRALLSCYAYMISPNVKHTAEDCAKWKSSAFGFPIDEGMEKELFGMSCTDTVNSQQRDGNDQGDQEQSGNVANNPDGTVFDDIADVGTFATGTRTTFNADRDRDASVRNSISSGTILSGKTWRELGGGKTNFNKNTQNGTSELYGDLGAEVINSNSSAVGNDKEDGMFSDIFGFNNKDSSSNSKADDASSSSFFGNLFGNDSDESDQSEVEETQEEKIAREKDELVAEQERISKLRNDELLERIERMNSEQAAMKSQLQDFFNQGKDDKSKLSSADQSRIEELEKRLAESESSSKRLQEEARQRNLVNDFMSGTSRSASNSSSRNDSIIANPTPSSFSSSGGTNNARNFRGGSSNFSSASGGVSGGGTSSPQATASINGASISGSSGQAAFANLGPLLTSSEVRSLSSSDIGSKKIFGSLAAAELVISKGSESALYREGEQLYIIERIEKEGPLREGESEFMIVKKLVQVDGSIPSRAIASEPEVIEEVVPQDTRPARNAKRVEDLINALDNASDY